MDDNTHIDLNAVSCLVAVLPLLIKLLARLYLLFLDSQRIVPTNFCSAYYLSQCLDNHHYFL